MGFSDPEMAGVFTKAHFLRVLWYNRGRPMALCKKQHGRGVPPEMGFSDPEMAGAFCKGPFSRTFPGFMAEYLKIVYNPGTFIVYTVVIYYANRRRSALAENARFML